MLKAFINKRPICFALLLTLAVAAPTLTFGFSTDDYIQQLALEAYLGVNPAPVPVLDTYSDPLGLFNAFHFFQGNEAELRLAIRNSEVPWWTLPQLKVTFWRPLSSLLMMVDYQLFGRSPAGYHAHSVLWLLSLVGVWGLLLRRLLPGGLGVLALVLFAIDSRHFMPVGWTANRNALVTAVPALLGLLAHVRYRTEGWRPGRWLGPGCLAVALLCGEAALGAFGYLLAFELWGAPGDRRQRALGLAPFIAIGLLWAVSYKLMGFGTFGSGLYVDPTSEPLTYLPLAIQRIVVLLGAQLGGLPSELWLFAPTLLPLQVGYGLLMLLVAGLLLHAAWPSLLEQERKAVRWLLPGGILALLPVVATFTLDRLLLLPGLGGSVIVAIMLRSCWRALRSFRAGTTGVRVRACLLPPLALVHVVAQLGTWGALSVLTTFATKRVDEVISGAEMPTRQVDRSDVIVVYASDPIIAIYLPIVMSWQGRPMPRSLATLSLSRNPQRLTRIGARRFELRALTGTLLETAFEQLYRGKKHPLQQGEVIKVKSFSVRIKEVVGGRPTVIEVETDRSLDDATLHFLAWRDGGLRKLVLPPHGEHLDLRWSVGPMGL